MCNCFSSIFFPSLFSLFFYFSIVLLFLFLFYLLPFPLSFPFFPSSTRHPESGPFSKFFPILFLLSLLLLPFYSFIPSPFTCSFPILFVGLHSLPTTHPTLAAMAEPVIVKEELKVAFLLFYFSFFFFPSFSFFPYPCALVLNFFSFFFPPLLWQLWWNCLRNLRLSNTPLLSFDKHYKLV